MRLTRESHTEMPETGLRDTRQKAKNQKWEVSSLDTTHTCLDFVLSSYV